ncbi:sorbosone dehydrogenase family protein [Kangiella sp. TOML190]|uniref:PQQ-dependent sugar dehydrogenase n=1 Tax=Kangiella sp. TOML190 TaxID=2931351 RepID=UPI0020416F48|nr:PQQ-dependent sugar dehydrogenase [Kangiella sp. TOML190]
MINQIKLALFTLLYATVTFVHSAEVPKGFQIDVFASEVEGARQMALSKTGIIYVGSMRAGKVHAVIDSDGDFKADKTVLVMDGLNLPSGLAYKDGDLYIAEVDQVIRIKDIDTSYDKSPKSEVVYDNLPDKSHHGWKYTKFGPDGRLYVPIGVPCNICLSEDKRFGTIVAIDVTNGESEVVANGVRNSVGFDWDPKTKHLWFTDNGRDMMGDDVPPCELNQVSEAGQFFGFPYVHGKAVKDPKFYKRFANDRPKMDFVEPAWEFQAHVAPLGMLFYQGEQFPKEYQNSIFVAQHGSWNRSSKVGYKVVNLQRDEQGKVVSQTDFATGWLDGEETLGRPADVIMLSDGSLLISDDGFSKIYRVSYNGSAK